MRSGARGARLGEQFGTSGAFPAAVALGYDVAMRAMKTVGPGMKETHTW